MPKPIKTVTVRIFEPGSAIARTRRCCALKGKHWTEPGIQQLLEYLAAEIEKVMPTEEYELVELAADRFNFVHRGKRSDAVETLVCDSSAADEPAPPGECVIDPLPVEACA
jgi:hypothetical protein